MDARRCPACGRDNQCGAATGAQTCWCFSAAVDQEFLRHFARTAPRTKCLCAECACGAVPSPCVGECALDPGTQTCFGCQRTAREIGEWEAYGPLEKIAALRRIRSRRAER